ncbi:MAG: HAD family hydrolase, partial [Bacteroidales bacterium]|nr:HAD family hydrolase [Bacteroidales bacterium]
MSTIKVISFDGDDTLWQNENFFQKFCSKFYDMLSEYGTTEEISKKLYDTEVKNIAIYGYGAKSMMLSMIETYCKITDGNGDIEIIDKIIKQGQQLLQMPVNLLDGVKEAVSTLKSTYKLVLATKGDLTDQKRKIDESGLQKYFYHIEIMAEKNATGYRELLDILDCAPENFLMVGNSMKSD